MTAPTTAEIDELKSELAALREEVSALRGQNDAARGRIKLTMREQNEVSRLRRDQDPACVAGIDVL